MITVLISKEASALNHGLKKGNLTEITGMRLLSSQTLGNHKTSNTISLSASRRPHSINTARLVSAEDVADEIPAQFLKNGAQHFRSSAIGSIELDEGLTHDPALQASAQLILG